MTKAACITSAPAMRSNWGRGAGGSASGDEVVDQHDALAFPDGIGMYLEPVGAVFERVIDADGFRRQFAGLAHGDEPDPERDRHRRAEDEPARFHARNRLGFRLAGAIGQPGDGRGKPGAVTDQGGDVAELDARRREVRHRAHKGLQCLAVEAGGQPFFPGFIAAQICCLDM